MRYEPIIDAALFVAALGTVTFAVGTLLAMGPVAFIGLATMVLAAVVAVIFIYAEE